LNNTLLHDQWVIKQTRKEKKSFLEFNENESTTYENLWDTAKAVLRGKFIVMSAYIKNTERSQTPRKTRTTKPKTSRREIIKIRVEINEIETKNTIQRINKTKSWFFKKVNKIDKLLANLTQMRRGKTQVNKIRNENGEIATNTKKIQGIVRGSFENLYSSKLENLEKKNKLLHTYDHP
jgi:hypothetical protein